jgi:hypothetical protein
MSYSNKYANTNTNTNTNTSVANRKQKDEQRRKAWKDNKGNWEYSFFQKKFNPDEEAGIKVSMRPENGFNPKNVHQYITPEISREEQIVNKKQRGENLKSTEKIVYDNYTRKCEEAIKADIAAIKSQGLSAKPQTKEGRTRLLLQTLIHQLQKNNKELVANIYLRLMEDQFELTPEICQEYSKQIAQMNAIVEELDIIKLQFTKFHSQMPPLNVKGFKKFDDWQVKVIEYADMVPSVSVVVNAPTSAGKSVLSAYVTTKGKVLYVVPTDALAWQMSAYIGHILGTNVPIVTATYQTSPSRDEMIEILNRAPAIVGTADSIVDYLPFVKNEFKWIVLDEVHMIGKPEGSAMEHIVKVLPDIPILALSATIGNTTEIVDWFKSLSPNKRVEQVSCDKRFFNLQRYYYDPDANNLVCLHPLALVDESQIADKSICKKSLQPTPPNAWDLAMKLKEKFGNIGDLDPYVRFSTDKRIELDDANIWFNKLVEFVADKYVAEADKDVAVDVDVADKDVTDRNKIMDIISQYKQEALVSSSVDLVKLAFKLKAEDKAPAIIFQKNTIACLRLAREFAKNIENLEYETHPKLFLQRIKDAKRARRIEKKVKKSDTDNKDSNSKKETKQMMEKTKLKRDGYGVSSIPKSEQQIINAPSIQEPHPDFNLNTNQYFSEGTVEGWLWDLKKYFPNTGDYYHFMIKLLWRGVGVYAKGLPDPYLRLVQSLACQKQLAIVLSDHSLVFGVSMPFRTMVVIRDEKLVDDLDPMMFHQMSGRAGRRGLDKEGNVVFAGYSWNRIKELSISEAPVVKGVSNPIYTIPHANQLSKLFETNQNWDNTCKNFLDKTVCEEDSENFLQDITSNYSGGWKFAMIPDNVNHLHMNWKLRYSDESLLASLLVPYLRLAFESKDHTQENNQIDLAHFICRFISTKSTKNSEYALNDPAMLANYPYDQILTQITDLQIDNPQMIDNRLFVSIRQNSVVKLQSEDATDELRHRLMDLSDKIKHIQHFCFHSKITGLSRILGKLLTRIWWIYHTSSPIMKPFQIYDTDEFINIDQIQNDEDAGTQHSDEEEDEDDEADAEADYESESDDGSSDYCSDHDN